MVGSGDRGSGDWIIRPSGISSSGYRNQSEAGKRFSDQRKDTRSLMEVCGARNNRQLHCAQANEGTARHAERFVLTTKLTSRFPNMEPNARYAQS
jgi:hypothetical protein